MGEEPENGAPGEAAQDAAWEAVRPMMNML